MAPASAATAAPALPLPALTTVARAAILALGLLAAAVAPPAWAQGAAASAARPFQIAPGSLASALAGFAADAGVNVSAAPELVRGKTTQGLQGSHTVAEALRRLLAGTGLEAVPAQGGGYVLRTAPVAPVAPVDGSATLPEVQVTAAADKSGTTERTGAYSPRVTRSATRMPLSLRETPQSVTVITAQQIEDRGVASLVEAMGTTTGVVTADDGLGRISLYSRGLGISNIQVDGYPMLPSGQGIPGTPGDNMIAYDRIEVLRGANGLLAGPGDPSGSITLIRKRPTRQLQAHVQGGLGSWGNRFGDADISGSFNESGTVRGRVAVGGYDGNGFIENTGRDGKALLATVEVDLSPRTVVRAGYHHDEYKIKNGGNNVPLWYSNGQPYDAPRSISRGVAFGTIENRMRNLFAGLEHAFDNGWEFQGSVDHSRRELATDRIFSLTMPAYPNPSGLGMTLYNTLPRPGDDSQWAYNFDFQGPVTLFGREHRLMVGASGWDRKRELKEVAEDLSGRPSDSFVANYPTWLGSTRWVQPYPWHYTGFARSKQYTQQHGIFAAARWNLADSLKLITGVRVTSYKTHTDQFNGQTGAHAVRREITPYVGAVWDFHPNMSAYASYADIFKPQNLYDSSDNLLKPIVGKNYEAGLKGEFLNKKLNASLAVFRLVQDNLGERDPSFPADHLTPGGNAPYRSVGKGITTRGFEAEVSGTPSPGWNIGAGYTYAKSRKADGNPYDPNQPEHLLRVFTTYRLQGDWSGLTLGVGGSWNSSISRVLQRPTGAYLPNGPPVTAGSEFRQGGVWLLNAMARYEFTPQLSLLLNVENLLDKKYYSNIESFGPLATYGTPRRWRATLRYQY